MANIDLYDKRILYELDKDSRQSAQKIAKKVHLSKVSVIQRINRLKKKGVVEDFITLIDYRKMGFTNYHVYYSLRNLSQEKEENFIKFLKKENGVRYIVQIDSKWDLMLALFTESNEKTDEILNKINEKYGDYIKEIKIFTIITTFYSGRNYLTKEKRNYLGITLIRKKSDIIKLDKIDHSILKNISLNSRIPFIELESIVNIKADVLRYHLKNLLKKGIIQRFTINLNNEKFGNSFYKLLLHITPDLKKEIIMKFISKYKNSLRIHYFLGEKIIEADFEVENDKEIRKIVKDIKENYGNKIKELEILPVYLIRKIDYYPRN